MVPVPASVDNRMMLQGHIHHCVCQTEENCLLFKKVRTTWKPWWYLMTSAFLLREVPIQTQMEWGLPDHIGLLTNMTLDEMYNKH